MNRSSNAPREALLRLIGTLGVGLGVVAAASGPLPAPPPTFGVELDAWYEALGPSGAALAVVRLLVGAVLLWLAMATILQLLATWVRSLRLLADLVAPPMLRGLAGGVASLSLGLVSGPPPLMGDEPSTAVLRPLNDAPEADASVAPTSESTSTTTTLSPVTPAVVDSASQATPESPAAPPDAGLDGDGENYEVRPGDHLWALAAEVVGDSLGTAPSDSDVARYWKSLMSANRDRLVDPTNFDLIYPGQVLRLPPVHRG